MPRKYHADHQTDEKKIQAPERTTSPVALEGEVLSCPPGVPLARVPTLASPDAQTCVVLALTDATQPANAAIGHFDTPHNIRHTVIGLVKDLTDHGAKPANIKATLVGGTDAAECCCCSFFCSGCCEFSSNKLMSQPIKLALREMGVPTANIKHEDSSFSLTRTSSYCATVDRKTGEVTTVANSPYHVRRLLSQVQNQDPHRIEEYAKRIERVSQVPNQLATPPQIENVTYRRLTIR